MNQWREEMMRRTHAFAVDVVRFVQGIPDRSDTRRLTDQLQTFAIRGSPKATTSSVFARKGMNCD
jgi:hypothetical protein